MPNEVRSLVVSSLLSAALSAQFGQAPTEGLPPHRGAIVPLCRLVRLAEHLVQREVESSVIEGAMKAALRSAVYAYNRVFFYFTGGGFLSLRCRERRCRPRACAARLTFPPYS
jgi:hypothetical protein